MSNVRRVNQAISQPLDESQFERVAPSSSLTDHPVLSEFNTILTEIKETENRLNWLRQQLNEEVKALPAKIGENQDLRDAILSHLYWSEQRLQGKFVLQAFNMVVPAQAKKGSTNILKGIIIDATCTQCHELIPILITSRSALASLDLRGKVCDTCHAKNQQDARQYYNRYLEERARRLHELQTMPYAEYLKTPEWQETRRRAMKRAGFRCQVCNSYGVQLNVHHRTYKRRGQELNLDLITLCENCHQIFHENGKLANKGVGE